MHRKSNSLKILGIDASNIRSGGGITHLVELLRVADPRVHGFKKIIIWAPKHTLQKIFDRFWLIKKYDSALDGNNFTKFLWLYNRLGPIAKSEKCDLLFVPGGSVITNFTPVVTMSRNLLPFELRELLRFRFSPTTLRLLLLRSQQSRSVRKANGVIYLTRYALNTVNKVARPKGIKSIIIPHGIEHKFLQKPRHQLPISEYNNQKPFRIIYVSVINRYKHQREVFEAVSELSSQGFPVALTLIGPAYNPSLVELKKTIKKNDPEGKIVQYLGEITYDKLHKYYEKADLCVFASSCENMPNILLEGMASGLPIACSDRGPMPEILNNGGVYFDPDDIDSISKSIKKLVLHPMLREKLAWESFNLSQKYSWERCAESTFNFLNVVAEEYCQD